MHLVTHTVSYIYQESDVGARDNTRKKEIGALVTYLSTKRTRKKIAIPKYDALLNAAEIKIP